MALQTLTLSATKWAYIDQANPSTHYSVSDGQGYVISDRSAQSKYLLFGLGSVSSSLKRKRITRFIFKVQAAGTDLSTEAWKIHPALSQLYSDFNANSVTWNTRPDIDAGTETAYNSSTDTGWNDFTVDIQASASDPRAAMTRAQQIVQYHGFALKEADGIPRQAKNKLKNGSAALVTITYDDALDVVSQVYADSAPSGIFDPRQDAVFHWYLGKQNSGYYCADENFVQTSAKFYWKLSTDANWNEISISGATSQVTIPAMTFATASTVQWYVQVTDADGTTSQTVQASFTTPITTVNPRSYPTGNNKNTQVPITFEWSLSSPFGDYDQSAATLYWRKEGDENYTPVAASPGSAKSITIPADTFPTSTTIEWYLAATDTGGHSSQSDVRSFSTPSLSISMVSYPTGSNHSPLRPISFDWVYRNSVFSDYNQSSAILYWRKVDDPDYTEIEIAGNTKHAEIPANTLPTNAQVQWYLKGTDSGGTVHQTTALTFKTLKTQVTVQDSPTSGYWDPRYAMTFSWFLSSPAGDYPQASASIFWKESEDDEYTEIEIAGNTKEYTFAANFFPTASSIDWYIEATDTGGYTSQTETFTFSTEATTANALCVRPIGRVEDGTKPITFEWIVTNDDGSAPTRTVILWKYDTETALQWKTLLDTTSEIYSYTVPPETFEAGAIEWKVSAYNRDDVEGPANEASFICLNAPAEPTGLTATPVPRTTVRWQSGGQQAYEITIDGVIVKKEYGPGVYSYQQEEPLSDGEHLITVRVQGIYGLWSNPAETSIYVENDPAVDITLGGVFDLDAALSWEYDSTVTDPRPMVYRDGIRIAALHEKLDFTDRFVLGEHSYYIELWDSDGNYSRSNTVTGTMEAAWPQIASVEGGNWISLRLSENSNRSAGFQWSVSNSLQHVLGADYPIMEIGHEKSFIGSFDCAFRTPAEARAFEALNGRRVIMKTFGQQAMTGVLTAYDKKIGIFYVSYSFTLRRIHLEEFVRDD